MNAMTEMLPEFEISHKRIVKLFAAIDRSVDPGVSIMEVEAILPVYALLIENAKNNNDDLELMVIIKEAIKILRSTINQMIELQPNLDDIF